MLVHLVVSQHLLDNHRYAESPSPRDHYLRALAERRAARQAYEAELLDRFYASHTSRRAPPSSALLENDHSRPSCKKNYHGPFLHRTLVQCLQNQKATEARDYLGEQRIAGARTSPDDARERPLSKRQKTQSKKRAHLDKAFAARFGVTDGIHALPAYEARAGLSHRNNPAASEKAQIRSKPSPALDELTSIRSHLDSISSSFSFPTHLVFDASSKDAPNLTYNAVNATLHSYEDALSKILDAVESNGDEEIRFARKEIARAIEATLSDLDSKKEAAWQKLKGFPTSEQISDQIRDDLDKPAPGAERSIGHSVSPVVPEAHRRSPGVAPRNRTDEDKETETPLNVSLEDAIRDLAPLDPSGIPTRLVSSRDRATSVADSDPNAAPQTPMPSIDNASHISEHDISSADLPSVTSASPKYSHSDDDSSHHIEPNSLNGVTSSEPPPALTSNAYLVPSLEEQSAVLPPPPIDTTSELPSNLQYSGSENARSENTSFIEHLDRKNQSRADVAVDSVSSESAEDSIDLLDDHDVSESESFEMVY